MSVSVSGAPSAALPPATGGKVVSSLDVAATLFGMSRQDVRSRLDSGSSLDDLANDVGVPSATLRQALVANMPAALARSADPDEIARQIASETRAAVPTRAPLTSPRADGSRLDVTA